MEEILASIRRIISEDDAPADAVSESEPEEESAPAAPEPVAVAAEPEPEEEVLDLVDPLPAPPPAETHGDLDVFTAPAPAAAPEPTFEPEPEPVFTPAPAPKLAPASVIEPQERLVGDYAAGAAASAFGSLAAAVTMPKEGRTLEDVTRELLRPLIKAWLDENLPRIVEAKVEEEVQRIARLRG
jgi:cell pole-organizing protein PopZ